MVIPVDRILFTGSSLSLIHLFTTAPYENVEIRGGGHPDPQIKEGEVVSVWSKIRGEGPLGPSLDPPLLFESL